MKRRKIHFMEINHANVTYMSKYMQYDLGDLMTVLNRDWVPGKVMVPYFGETEAMKPTDPVSTETCLACNMEMFSMRGPQATFHLYLFHKMVRHFGEYQQIIMQELGLIA